MALSVSVIEIPAVLLPVTPVNFLLLSDGVSFLLLTDGTSYLILAGTGPTTPIVSNVGIVEIGI